MSRWSRMQDRWTHKLRLFPCPNCGRRNAVAVNRATGLFYCFDCVHGGSIKPNTVEGTV